MYFLVSYKYDARFTEYTFKELFQITFSLLISIMSFPFSTHNNLSLKLEHYACMLPAIASTVLIKDTSSDI